MDCVICMTSFKKYYKCNSCEIIACTGCLTRQLELQYSEIQKPKCCNCKNIIYGLELPTVALKKLFYQTLRRYLYEKQFEPQFNILDNNKKMLEELLRERHETLSNFPENIKYIINNVLSKDINKINLGNKKNIEDIITKTDSPCIKPGCVGRSLDNKCIICKTIICTLCERERLEDHKCKKEDIDTLKFIKEDTKQCPECNTRIHRSSGCAEMTCTFCGTNFYYHDPTRSSHGNPHNANFDYMGFISIENEIKNNKFDNIINNKLYTILQFEPNDNINLFNKIKNKKLSDKKITEEYFKYKLLKNKSIAYYKIKSQIVDNILKKNLTITLLDDYILKLQNI